MSISIVSGYPEPLRQHAAQLYWEAFRGKLGPVMGPERLALQFLEKVLDPGHAISALDGSQNLIGIAGFKTRDGAMVGGTLSDMTQVYGTFGGLWRGLLLSILERKLEEDVLLMDGICVAAHARGNGVGSALLAAIKREAAVRGCAAVRLDVIDTNPRAEALYRRQGFVAKDREELGPLRHLFGFRSALRMEYAVA